MRWVDLIQASEALRAKLRFPGEERILPQETTVAPNATLQGQCPLDSGSHHRDLVTPQKPQTLPTFRDGLQENAWSMRAVIPSPEILGGNGTSLVTSHLSHPISPTHRGHSLFKDD